MKPHSKEVLEHVQEYYTTERGSHQGGNPGIGEKQRGGNAELLNKEAEELTRAGRYERTEARQGYRSGHYSRKLMTTAGEVRLEIPKLKGIPFETAIIERYRRRESSVEEALIEMYLAGVSVRRVEDISEALWGSRVSGCHHQRSESESLRPYRRMAQPSARREVSIRLRRRYLPQAQLGRRIRERQHSGGHRRG